MGNKLKENIFSCSAFFSAVKQCIINLEVLILFPKHAIHDFYFSFMW